MGAYLHMGDDATPERVLMADRAAKLVVKVAALETAAEQRRLTDNEVETLLQSSRMLGLVTRRLGIVPE